MVWHVPYHGTSILGENLFKSIGLVRFIEAFRSGETGYDLVNLFDDNGGRTDAKKVDSFNGEIPGKPEMEYLRVLVNRAYRSYLANNPGVVDNQDTKKNFILSMYWRAGGPQESIPRHADSSSKYVLAPVLSESMKYMVLEAMRMTIEKATKSVEFAVFPYKQVGAMKKFEIQPYARRNLDKALEAVRQAETRLNQLLQDASNPSSKLNTKAGDSGFPFESGIASDRGAFLVHQSRQARIPTDLGLEIANLYQSVARALFDGLDTSLFRTTSDSSGILYGGMEAGEARSTLASRWLFLQLNVYDQAARLNRNYKAVKEKFLSLIRGTDYNHDTKRLLEWNGLVEVAGTRVEARDGYDYFEARDATDPRRPSVMCRVYRGETGLLAKGIEMFVTGAKQGEFPDPNVPVVPTGHVHTTDAAHPGLRDTLAAVQDAPDEQYYAALYNWLGSRSRIQTNRLNAFYGLLISPSQ